MKLKIVSNGFTDGTRVYNADTGDELKHIREIVWSLNAADGVAFVTITFSMPAVDLESVIDTEALKTVDAYKGD